jgi:hypothetical protein
LIPRGGYRAEDMLDDGVGLESRESPSAEGLMAAIVHGRRRVAEVMRAELAYGARAANPSAEGWMLERGANSPEEVREPGAVYRIRPYRRMELFRAKFSRSEP